MLDQFRELRFLVPPFFFFASLLWGAYLDPCFSLVSKLSKVKDGQTIVIAAVGASTIPLGFLISVTGIPVITLFFRLFGKQWDIPYSNDSVKTMLLFSMYPGADGRIYRQLPHSIERSYPRKSSSGYCAAGLHF